MSRPTFSARITKLPLMLMVPPITRACSVLAHRHGFAGHHQFIERGVALQHDAVDRHLVAGPHAQFVADCDGVERDFFVAAVVFDAARGLGREIEQRLDRAGGRLARAQFEHLADQHQHGDHAGGFEVDRRRAAVAAEGVGENAGRERGDDAVDVGDAGAHADQREHVEVARDQRLRAAHEERPARPQHHRRGEGELDVIRQRGRDPMRGPTKWPPISSTMTGSASTRPIQNRRVMSASSGLGPLSAVASPAPTPCRRSGRRRGRSGGSRDASGRCRSRLR